MNVGIGKNGRQIRHITLYLGMYEAEKWHELYGFYESNGRYSLITNTDINELPIWHACKYENTFQRNSHGERMCILDGKPNSSSHMT